MARLNTKSIADVPQSVMIYGAPKSGKTELIGQLAKEYTVYFIDIENGISTLMKLPEEYQANIEVISIKDNKENPTAINTVAKLMTGDKVEVCEKHGKSPCGVCKSKGDPINTYHFNELDNRKEVVVVDSLTQLTSSAQAHVCRKLNLEVDKMTFEHYRVQQVLLEKVLDLVQNSQFHVVFTSHELGIDQADKVEKIVPAGGTKNFARLVAKYFGHIIHMSVKNKKHKASSCTTDNNNILTGSRTNTVVDVTKPETFLALFREAGKVSSSDSASTAKGANPQASSTKKPNMMDRFKKS